MSTCEGLLVSGWLAGWLLSDWIARRLFPPVSSPLRSAAASSVGSSSRASRKCESTLVAMGQADLGRLVGLHHDARVAAEYVDFACAFSQRRCRLPDAAEVKQVALDKLRRRAGAGGADGVQRGIRPGRAPAHQEDRGAFACDG
eukprot:scaffold91265_cov65-Phaeocystis_antarctica.AAC.1